MLINTLTEYSDLILVTFITLLTDSMTLITTENHVIYSLAVVGFRHYIWWNDFSVCISTSWTFPTHCNNTVKILIAMIILVTIIVKLFFIPFISSLTAQKVSFSTICTDTLTPTLERHNIKMPYETHRHTHLCRVKHFPQPPEALYPRLPREFPSFIFMRSVSVLMKQKENLWCQSILPFTWVSLCLSSRVLDET